MGYTTQRSGLLLGLGVSAISETSTAFAQNEKTLHDYYTRINHDHLAIRKGYILNEEDQLFRQSILDISCKGETVFNSKQSGLLEQFTFPELETFAEEGLVKYNTTGLQVTRQGHHFIRNICSAFDMHLHRVKARVDYPLFSKAI
jgi:oxygen-independent coproporphyrinogen-3 oxidase